MKSPAELAAALARQWHSADQRERRLLDPTTWPLPLTIGHPPASVFESRTAEVRAHIERWRAVGVGAVEWQETRYRSAAEAVLLPSEAFVGDQMVVVDPDAIRRERLALQAAIGRALEIDRVTLYNKMRKYGIDRP